MLDYTAISMLRGYDSRYPSGIFSTVELNKYINVAIRLVHTIYELEVESSVYRT